MGFLLLLLNFRPISADSDALSSFLGAVSSEFPAASPPGNLGRRRGRPDPLLRILVLYGGRGGNVCACSSVSVVVRNAGFVTISAGSVAADCHVFVALFGLCQSLGRYFVLWVIGSVLRRFEFAGFCGDDTTTGCSALHYYT